MPVSSKEARVQHNNLFLRLNETFSPDSSSYKALQRAVRAFLPQGTVERCKDIDQLAEKLQNHGHIKVGEYSKLKQMVRDANCNVDEICEIIEETENRIKEIQAKHGPVVATPAALDNIDNQSQTPVKQVAGAASDLGGVGNESDTGTNSDANPCESLEKLRYTKGKGKGLCLILNFFSEDRTATENDVESLTSFWQSVGCDVIVEKDLSEDEVITKLTKCHTHLENSLFDCRYFVCAILSHGDEKGICTNGGGHITLTYIMDMFKNDKLQAFCGKPKVFLVQACRGGKDQAGHADHSDDQPVDMSDLFPKVPTDADILLACATTPGYKAYRRDNVGSWFIHELTSHLKRYHTTEHFEEILISVRHKVGIQYETGPGIKQMPCTWSTLTKRFYV